MKLLLDIGTSLKQLMSVSCTLYQSQLRNGFLDCSYGGSTRTVGGTYITEVNPKTIYQSNLCGHGGCNCWKNTNYGAVQHIPTAPPCFSEEATFLCHGNHSEPCADSNIGLVGLLLALTLHSILEGLAIGLQKAVSEVGDNKYLY